MSTLDTELFKKPEENFIKHLQLPENDRIIFSGKFGTGKTSFLKHFFTDQGNGYAQIKNTKYEIFHLYPVNYSIASTEDILELIKYDITLELLKKNNHLSIHQDDIDTTIPFIKEHYDKLITLLLTAIPKVDKVLDVVDFPEVFKQLLEIRKSYKDHKKESNKTVNEGNSLAEFLEETQNTIGNLYESNFISRIIENVLTRHKDAHTNPDTNEALENILILDDLDRIDPEHIFRILNVFAAHFDTALHSTRGLKNKFGFDKVILVCDINNVRKIFTAKYGQKVDFTGYIDKFYSSHIFYFLSGTQLKSFLVDKLMFNKIIHNNDDYQVSKVLGQSNIWMIIDVLLLLYKNDSLSLRKILALPLFIDAPRDVELYGSNHRLDGHKGLVVLYIITTLLGGYNDTKESFEHLKSLDVDLTQIMARFSHELFRIRVRLQHRFSSSTDYLYDPNRLKYQQVKIKRVYTSRGEDAYEVVEMNGSSIEKDRIVFTNEDIYDYMFDGLLYIKQLGLVV